MTTAAEQIAEFVRRHPAAWQTGEWRGEASLSANPITALALPTGAQLILADTDSRVTVWAVRQVAGHIEHIGFAGAHASLDAPLLSRVASRVADCLQLRGGQVTDLPPWLADPVSRELRRRAGELLTLAGSSPADVVSAAETVDEALCARPPVAPTFSAVTNALMAIGMSCGWIGGDPLILVGDFVYLRADLNGAPIDDFAAFTEKHGARRMVKGDKSSAPAVPGYRVFMALAPEVKDP